MAPASSSEVAEKPHKPVPVPGFYDCRGGVMNPFYDRNPNSVPLSTTSEKLVYYTITCPIALARGVVSLGSIFFYLLYLLSVTPLMTWLRSRSPIKDSSSEMLSTSLLYKLLLLWPGRICGFFITLGLGFKVKVRAPCHALPSPDVDSMRG